MHTLQPNRSDRPAKAALHAVTTSGCPSSNQSQKTPTRRPGKAVASGIALEVKSCWGMLGCGGGTWSLLHPDSIKLDVKTRSVQFASASMPVLCRVSMFQ